MERKPAFVFDTNFILQMKSLDKVLENLQEKFSVYVPQVCIDERIAQECRELRAQFGEIESLQKRCGEVVSIEFRSCIHKRFSRV